MALIRQNGPPSLFMTFSMAEAHWTDLLKILWMSANPGKPCPTGEQLLQMGYKEKADLIRSDAINIARHYSKRMGWLQKDILMSAASPVVQVVDYKSRCETQQRGSLHEQGLYYVKNTPKLYFLLIFNKTDYFINADKFLITVILLHLFLSECSLS